MYISDGHTVAHLFARLLAFDGESLLSVATGSSLSTMFIRSCMNCSLSSDA